MRDKNRIPKILNELERIWQKNPDLRLGQLIMIATRPKTPCPEVFSIEDDDILKGIRAIEHMAETASETNKRVPYWEVYPEIIRVKVEELTPALIHQFIEAVRKEKPDLILNPRSMMKLIGAPVEDINWLNKQQKRIEHLDLLLKQFAEKGSLEIAEVGYKII